LFAKAAIRNLPDSGFEFQKRSQFFICSHNATLSVVAMCVSDEDCSPAAIHSCAPQAPSNAITAPVTPPDL